MSAWNAWGTGVVYRSDDGGATWAATPWTGPAISDIVCDVDDADVLYIASPLVPKVQRSDDAGLSFAAFDDGLASAGESRELRQHPDGSLLLATSRGSFGLGVAGDDTIFANGFESGD